MSSKIEVQRICEYCNKEFTARTTKTRYCSHTCNRRAYKAKLRSKKVDNSNKETQRIILQPIETLKAKPFLSISDASRLLGISRRTIYRMVERGELKTGKAGRRTIIQRSDIDKLFI